MFRSTTIFEKNISNSPDMINVISLYQDNFHPVAQLGKSRKVRWRTLSFNKKQTAEKNLAYSQTHVTGGLVRYIDQFLNSLDS